MAKYFLIAGVLFCAGVAAYGVSGQERSEELLALTIGVYQSVGEGAQKSVLAEPVVATTPGRPFSVSKGGQIKAASSDDELNYGTQVSGTMKCLDAERVQVELSIRVGSPIVQEDDPETTVIRSDCLDIVTILRRGETKQPNCSGSMWCELKVESASP